MACVHQVTVTFPEGYGNAELAGKDGTFEVDVKEIREKVKSTIDDEFAKSMGLDGVDTLRTQVKERLQADYGNVSRERLKRQLLDKLDESHEFDAPVGMVDAELDSIWNQFEAARKNDELDPEDKDKSDDEIRDEFRTIAQRRVRLGLLLAAVGQRNNIEVSQEEMNRALIRQAQNFPGQERQIIETYQKNENLMASLRAPIFEDKVVDFILELAKVTDRSVSIDDLMKDPSEDAPADEKPKARAKRPAAKKKPASKSKAKSDAKAAPKTKAAAKPKAAPKKKAAPKPKAKTKE